MFREPGRELTRADYERLLRAAHERGLQRLELLMETLCATGIRVSELGYITVEAAKKRRAEIALKGKIRVILLPGSSAASCSATRKAKNRLRRDIPHRERQAAGQATGLGGAQGPVQARGRGAAKVFPHNFRHLFARVFYKASRDLANWPTCWATRPWRRRGSTSRTPARST